MKLITGLIILQQDTKPNITIESLLCVVFLIIMCFGILLHCKDNNF